MTDIQNVDEPRHVGALEIMRQAYVHVEVGDRMLHALGLVGDDDGVPDRLDANLVDGDLAAIGRRLHVGHASHGFFLLGHDGFLVLGLFNKLLDTVTQRLYIETDGLVQIGGVPVLDKGIGQTDTQTRAV